jgi:V8-like Glu-specific endopeptidase
MVDLSPDDRARLLAILVNVEALASEQGRRDTLRDAGLADRAVHIDTSGAPQLAIGRIVEALARYGRRPTQPDVEVLGVFLNWVKNLVGVEEQTVLAELMRTYQMATPLANLPAVPIWKSAQPPPKTLEKIIGQNALRPIAFLARGLEVARAVAYVSLPDLAGSGTGFLVAPDLLLTNFHVLPDRATAERSVFRFNFQTDWNGASQPVDEYRAKPNGLYCNHKELDYALVELDRAAGATWGTIPMKPGAIAKDGGINIIQHAGGQYKQIAVQNNLVEYLDDRIVQYVTSTLPGSSGAPAFNDSWQLVALHHAGGDLLEPTSGRRHYRNEGIRISAILASLPPEVAARVG